MMTFFIYKISRLKLSIFTYLLTLSLFLFSLNGFGSDIKSDEIVTFFPTIGYPISEGWKIHIHGWIYEPELTSDLYELAYKLNLVEEKIVEDRLSEQRIRSFFVDNEGGKNISIRLGQKIYALPSSESNGHFSAELHLSAVEMKSLQATSQTPDFIEFEAITARNDPRHFTGQIQLLEPEGISVISDLDDTIKISEVSHKTAFFKNTFIHPFQAVPDMAALYQAWHQEGIQFHYVSGSPWPLYPALADFMSEQQFPPGSFHLRFFRWFDDSLLTLFHSLKTHKMQTIEFLLNSTPERQFILVGDSGQQDPEIYAHIARRYPNRILKIFIRELTAESTSTTRYQTTFKDLSSSLWTLFREPMTIKPIFKQ